MAQNRQKLVRELRSVARLCGVELVRDDASREKVMQMVQKTREAQPGATQLKRLEDAVAEYQETFGETRTPAAADSQEAQAP